MGPMANALGVDVASYQGLPDWAAAKADSIDFAFVKASQGLTYQSPVFTPQRVGAKSAGILVSPYHFATEASGHAQASHFLATVGNPKDDELPLMVDAEDEKAEDGTLIHRPTPQALVELGGDIRDAQDGRKGILYTGASYYYTVLDGDRRLVEVYDLFVASWYVSNPGPADWDRWLFHQYTNQGQVAGFAGRVDRDVFNGDFDQLCTLVPAMSRPRPKKDSMILTPPWGDVRGGQSDHYRVVRGMDGNAWLQGIGQARVLETMTPDGDVNNVPKWAIALGVPFDDVTGFTRSDDWSILFVAGIGWNTFEFHTGQHIVPAKGDKGDPGLPGAAGLPGQPGAPGATVEQVLKAVGNALVNARVE